MTDSAKAIATATMSTAEPRGQTLAERVSILERQAKTEPKKAALDLAAVYLEDGRPHAAIKLLETTRGLDEPARTILLARAYFDRFDNARARALLAKLSPASSLDNDARLQALQGELALEAGNTADAKKHLRRALTLAPGNAHVAQLLVNLGEDVLVPQPASSPTASEFRTVDPDAETPGRALRHLAIGLLLGVAFLGWYVWSAQRGAVAAALAADAYASMGRADVLSLRESERALRESLDAKYSDAALVGLAEVQTLLWAEHGVPEAQSAAKERVAVAAARDIQKAERYGAEALLAVAEGDYPRAIAVGETIKARGGTSEKVSYAVGLALRRQGKHHDGREALRRAQDQSSSAPHYARALGDAYEADGDLRNATFFWERAYKSNSNYLIGTARHLMGRLLRGEKPGAVREELERLAALPDGDRVSPRARAALSLTQAALAHRRGKLAEALAALDRVDALEGQQPRALLMRGQVQLAKGHTRAGLENLRAAYDRSAKAELYLTALASALARHGKPQDAVALLEGRVSPTPGQQAELQVRLGDAYRAADEPAKAMAAYEKALQLRDGFPDAVLGKAIVATSRGDFAAATELFNQAVTARPDYPELYQAVGIMFAARGDTARAVENWEEAERQLRTQGADVIQMAHFYDTVLETLGRAKGGAKHVAQWQTKKRAYFEGA